MTIVSTRETAWRQLQSKHGALLTPLVPVSLLLIVSTLAFASSVSDIAGPGKTEIFPQLMIPTGVELLWSSTLPSEFIELAPLDLEVSPGSTGPLVSSGLLNQNSARVPDGTPKPEQGHHVIAFLLIGVLLLAGGLSLFLRSLTFRNWFNQFLFDAFSPLKYD